MPHKVLLTDHYHPTLDEERRVLKGAGIEICDGNGRYETADDVITPGEDADAIVTQFMPITGDSSAPPSLQGHRPVRDRRGYDRQSAETEQRIMVANVPDDCMDEVSDHTLAPILALVRTVPMMDREARSGAWSYSWPRESPENRPQQTGTEPQGKGGWDNAPAARGVRMDRRPWMGPRFR